MITFDDKYNLIVFSDKEPKKKKGFWKKHWKKVALAGAGALALGAAIHYNNKKGTNSTSSSITGSGSNSGADSKRVQYLKSERARLQNKIAKMEAIMNSDEYNIPVSFKENYLAYKNDLQKIEAELRSLGAL